MSTEKLTPFEIRKQYKKLLGLEHIMKHSTGDNYFTMQDKLKKEMIVFLRLDFSCLSSKQMLKLCALVSTHRPVAPHAFLSYCSSLIEG